MPNRSSKKQPSDTNQLAKFLVDRLTGTAENPAEENLTPEQIAARVLGRKGGLKGGKARAEKLSSKSRRDIAKKAAMARWKRKSETSGS